MEFKFFEGIVDKSGKYLLGESFIPVFSLYDYRKTPQFIVPAYLMNSALTYILSTVFLKKRENEVIFASNNFFNIFFLIFFGEFFIEMLEIFNYIRIINPGHDVVYVA